VMGKIKSNWFMGIRTPWALSDPDVWNKTNRLGGWVFFLTGLVELPVSIWCPEKVMAAVLLVGILGGTILTYFMSWKWYKDKFEQNKED
ncbi:MAG: SdpI family protein, partial [Oscillospiraceae bacterium]|nr:SdpI family protein [Oscillospiraceae bacterium]